MRLGVFPMGIDAAHFIRMSADEQVAGEVEQLRRGLDGERMMLGVDRLDYTKGMARRLLALERLLEARSAAPRARAPRAGRRPFTRQRRELPGVTGAR